MRQSFSQQAYVRDEKYFVRFSIFKNFDLCRRVIYVRLKVFFCRLLLLSSYSKNLSALFATKFHTKHFTSVKLHKLAGALFDFMKM